MRGPCGDLEGPVREVSLAVDRSESLRGEGERMYTRIAFDIKKIHHSATLLLEL